MHTVHGRLPSLKSVSRKCVHLRHGPAYFIWYRGRSWQNAARTRVILALQPGLPRSAAGAGRLVQVSAFPARHADECPCRRHDLSCVLLCPVPRTKSLDGGCREAGVSTCRRSWSGTSTPPVQQNTGGNPETQRGWFPFAALFMAQQPRRWVRVDAGGFSCLIAAALLPCHF